MNSKTDPIAHGCDDVVIQTLPLFEMMRMRAATTARRHPTLGFAAADPKSNARWVNQFTHTHRRLGPEDKEVVSPNNDTVYSNAWLDLSEGPVVIETPDMGDRYWTLGLLDAWTNPFAYVGRRTTGNRSQRTLVHGPGWHGIVPADITLTVAAPGNDVWVIGRHLVEDDGEDAARVRASQSAMRLVRLDGADAAMRVDTWIDGRDAGIPTADLYLRIVSAALRRNPPLPGERLAWPPAAAGLAPSLTTVYERLRANNQPHDLGGGWAIPVMVKNNWGDDYLTRARIARNFIGALGIEEAMYPTAEVDARGVPLNGSQRYELRFAPGKGLKVDAFWSLTMYRRRDCLFVANVIDRYSIGDRTPGLHHDADGGLAIRLQAEDPGPGVNWLPAPQGESFYVVLRLYQPHADHLALKFDYPPIQPL
ncbi:hypothetical protein J2W32_005473 [Variovorax boronicumulans]|uniref:DUF1254 domain-containing protein n=1 Tax=Variovorax boronicumulans TaxID=436515 RepID=A0AAW8DA86_9BURK|nr:DUF1254 domain-containing protein [Variovorax boronicumulans]MDP9896285.1 hypothetical protein [Variovorax boronicumulans]MDQ0056405.1 hypothetical protein [Variovorax boronicumulans]